MGTDGANYWSITVDWLDIEGCLQYEYESQIGWSYNLNWAGLQTKGFFDEYEGRQIYLYKFWWGVTK